MQRHFNMQAKSFFSTPLPNLPKSTVQNGGWKRAGIADLLNLDGKKAQFIECKCSLGKCCSPYKVAQGLLWMFIKSILSRSNLRIGCQASHPQISPLFAPTYALLHFSSILDCMVSFGAQYMLSQSTLKVVRMRQVIQRSCASSKFDELANDAIRFDSIVLCSNLPLFGIFISCYLANNGKLLPEIFLRFKSQIPAGQSQKPKSAWQFPTPLQFWGHLLGPCGGACALKGGLGLRAARMVPYDIVQNPRCSDKRCQKG